MKKLFCTAIFAFVGLLVFAQERIAVFPFEDMENILTRNEMVMFYDEFSNEFTNRNGGRFSVVPRQDIERLINIEAAFQLSDFSAREKTAEMRRVLNGTQILSGRIGMLDSEIRVTVSLYSFPEIQRLPGGTTVSVANKNELFSRIPQLVQSILNTITGRPITNPLAVPANFVLAEGGTFTMGSSANENGRMVNEGPQHQVTLTSFYMGRYEVTQREFFDVMGRIASVYFYGDNIPILCSWYDAIEYCNRLSLREKLTPCYRGSGDNITCDWNANGYRLPTEAEWEYAAKGGNRDYLIYLYSGSNNPSSVAWYIGNIFKKGIPMAVGRMEPNSLGIYDMSGNVSEWCWDWYGNYSSNAQNNPRGPVTGEYRVTRGGGSSDSSRGIRSSRRNYNTPYDAWYSGFRVVRNAQ